MKTENWIIDENYAIINMDGESEGDMLDLGDYLIFYLLDIFRTVKQAQIDLSLINT